MDVTATPAPRDTECGTCGEPDHMTCRCHTDYVLDANGFRTDIYPVPFRWDDAPAPIPTTMKVRTAVGPSTLDTLRNADEMYSEQVVSESMGMLGVRELFRIQIVEEHSSTCESMMWWCVAECICIPTLVQIVD